MQEQIIVFTRYPEPGNAKTRLIPALGTEGAADLHRRMTEHTIAQARLLQQQCSVSIVVHFTGGNSDQMQYWLGHDLQYQPQHSGNLGDRLIYAFQLAFAQGATNVIAVGTDCPDVTAELLATGFEKSKTHGLVIGPASDGGYYLIGLQRLFSDLFTNIAWSTNVVLAQTLEIAQQLQLNVSCLPMLNDIDRPEDLENSANSLNNLSNG
jgi:uncharacterized protein